MAELVGREFNNTTTGLKDTQGDWKVVVTITEKITFDGVNWLEETIDAMGMDRTFDEAHKTALKSVLGWLQEYVYSKGFDNLVAAVQFYKELEEKDAKQVPDNNKDTAS